MKRPAVHQSPEFAPTRTDLDASLPVELPTLSDDQLEAVVGGEDFEAFFDYGMQN